MAGSFPRRLLNPKMARRAVVTGRISCRAAGYNFGEPVGGTLAAGDMAPEFGAGETAGDDWTGEPGGEATGEGFAPAAGEVCGAA